MVHSEEVTVEVRDGVFNRIGQVDVGLISSGKFIRRANAVGAWQFTLPNEHPLCFDLKRPGAGVLVWLGDDVYLSGPMLNWTKVESMDDPIGTTTFVGADDALALADKAAYPVPSTADVTTGQTSAYDVRTGAAETVMKGYVRANVGPGAPAERRDALNGPLLIEADQGRGSNVSASARFDMVGALLADIATTDGTLGFRVAQDPDRSGTTFSVYTIADRTATIRMDVDNDLLESAQSGVGAPTVTRPIVAGQGEAEDRQFYEVSNNDSTASEALWGRRIEQFIDQRQTSDVDQLIQAGTKALASGGATTVSLKVSPADSDSMRYGFDWNVGDLVGVVVDDQVLADVVSEAILAIDAGDVRVGATVGSPVGYDWEAAVTSKLSDHEARLGLLERST